MDFVKVDNYQDKFAFMLLDRIEKLESNALEMEKELREMKNKLYAPVPVPKQYNIEIFGLTTAFLYIKFPLKYFITSEEKHKEVIHSVMDIVKEHLPNLPMSVEVFVYTNSYIQFNITFSQPLHLKDILPKLYDQIGPLSINTQMNDFYSQDVVLVKYVCRVISNGDVVIHTTNFLYDF